MDNRGDRRAKIWITELGWGDKGPRHRFIVGRSGQAKRIKDSFKTVRKLRRKLKLRGLVYYSWRDGRPYAPLFEDEWGLHTGLLDVERQAQARLQRVRQGRPIALSAQVVLA